MTDSGRVLRSKASVGSGKAGHPMGTQGGDLAFAHIRGIESRERTVFYYTGPVLIAFVVVLYLTLHGAMKQ